MVAREIKFNKFTNEEKSNINVKNNKESWEHCILKSQVYTKTQISQMAYSCTSQGLFMMNQMNISDIDF